MRKRSCRARVRYRTVTRCPNIVGGNGGSRGIGRHTQADACAAQAPSQIAPSARPSHAWEQLTWPPRPPRPQTPRSSKRRMLSTASSPAHTPRCAVRAPSTACTTCPAGTANALGAEHLSDSLAGPARPTPGRVRLGSFLRETAQDRAPPPGHRPIGPRLHRLCTLLRPCATGSGFSSPAPYRHGPNVQVSVVRLVLDVGGGTVARHPSPTRP